MKRQVLWIATAVALAGCGGGVTREQLNTVKQQLEARDDQMAAQLRSDLTGVDQKYVKVQQLELKIEKQLEEMRKLHKELSDLASSMDAKVQLAAGNVVRALEFEERLMTDRLAQLRSLVQELKQPK